MTVKIKRYDIVNDIQSPFNANGKGIYDFLTHQIIMSFNTENQELNQLFAEMMLKALNTGNYEKYLTGEDE